MGEGVPYWDDSILTGPAPRFMANRFLHILAQDVGIGISSFKLDTAQHTSRIASYFLHFPSSL